MFAKNDEEKRNRLWEIIITVSTILIICIVAFFLIRMFTSNPLEGKWKYEDNGLLMTVKSGGNVVIEWPEENTDTIITVNMDYNINKDTKTFTLTTNEAAIRKAAEESGGAVTEERLTTNLEMLAATYDYNVEQNELTLTDSEFGEQMVFYKQ